MLFSAPEIALFILENFEPAWQSVRSVPTITMDFGEGEVVTRTLHGNIATYACTADGTVIDILPGIYDPESYLFGLQQLKYLHELYFGKSDVARFERILGMDGLASYHARQGQYLASGYQAQVLSLEKVKMMKLGGAGKSYIESGTKDVLALIDPKNLPPNKQKSKVYSAKMLMPKGDELRDWEALKADSEYNEKERRKQIHRRLAKVGPVRPDQIQSWLYKEVLNAELEDPYLGLKPLLTNSYPFTDR